MPPLSENVRNFAVQISTMRGLKAVTNISVEIQSLQKENLTKLIKTYKKICFIFRLLT